MFNKYRGLPQEKNIRKTEKELRTRKPVPQNDAAEKPPVSEPEELPELLQTSYNGRTEETRYSAEKSELLRQQEEDEWFLRFKGQTSAPKTEPSEPKTEPAPDVSEEPSDTGTVTEPEPLPFPDEIDQEEETAEGSSPIFSNEAADDDRDALRAELDRAESGDSSDSRWKLGADETTSEQTAWYADSPKETAEPVEEPELDDDRWMADLLSDIGTAGAENEPEEITEPRTEPYRPTEEEDRPFVDENSWYQSGSVLRTAAQIVLDMTETEEEPDHELQALEDALAEEEPISIGTETADVDPFLEVQSSETAEQAADRSYSEIDMIDEQISNADDDAYEAADIDEQPDPLAVLDEIIITEPEIEPMEASLESVDDRLSELMEEEPEKDISMEEMLDAMDRAIEQTAAPVPLAESRPAEQTPQKSLNPRHNRKKKKRNKR